MDIVGYERFEVHLSKTKWPLDELAYGFPTDGPYQTNPPSPDDIILSIRIDREGQVRRIRHEEEIDVHEYQILTREIVPTLKALEELSGKTFSVWGNWTMFRCLCYMLYCVVHSEKFNLAYYMAKRMEWGHKQKRLILPYESYVVYDRVMNPLAAQQERKTRKDHGTRRGHHSTFSSSAFDQPSFSHLNDDDDDDDGNGERTSRASTPSPIRYVNSLTNEVPQVFQNPPNIDPHLEPFYTSQTKIINRRVQIRDEHRGGLRSIGKGLRNLWRNIKKCHHYTFSYNNFFISNSSKCTIKNSIHKSNLIKPREQSFSSPLHLSFPLSSKTSNFSLTIHTNEPTSPQPLNPLLDNISDVPPRPLNPQPLQSHPSLDITLSLSPITPLDHIHDTPSPPSPQQPQPHIMGPLYTYNTYDDMGQIAYVALTTELFS
ncbi:hypothetical protein Tco_0390040 [Tanacetum coccineum]